MPPIADRPPTLLRALWGTLLVAAAAATAWFLFGVANRLGYPHELEWMEGAMVDHAARVADGLPLYAEPGPEHVPFLYAPLLFWLGGAAMALGLDGLLALRLVATAASLGASLVIGHWVRRETGRVGPGLAATGLFLAGYGWLAWWYDLARNDGLFLLAMLGTGYQLRHGGHRRWAWAAVLATLAFLAKQSALMWLPAIGLGALLRDWRQALRFGAATGAGLGGAVLALHLASDGWSTFFLFEMPRHHGWNGERVVAFWTEDLRPIWPLLALGLVGFAVAVRTAARGEALLLAAFGTGGLVTSWLSRLHTGGFDNVMLYGFAAACVLGPAAAAADRRWVRWLVPTLLLAQFAWLAEAAWARAPRRTLLPSAAHARAHDQLAAFVAAQSGPVWIPAHGGITRRLGKGTGAHGQAIFDLLQALPKDAAGMLDLAALHEPARLAHLPPRVRQAITAFAARTEAALRARHFAAIVVDEVGAHAFAPLFAPALVGADGVFGTDDDPYLRQPRSLLDEPTAIRPLLGYDVHTPHAWLRR
ncbi:MAG: hypothetical protein KF830_14395 [Planctomycetes bacterium]|nr:hypothetical protein [Planctomycetota bacterium]